MAKRVTEVKKNDEMTRRRAGMGLFLLGELSSIPRARGRKPMASIKREE
jgi:hypothetical protein